MTYCSVRDLASLFRKKHEETEKRSSRPEQLIASGSPASTDFQRSHNQQSLLFSDITMTVGDHETTVNSGSNPSIPSASASDSEISDKNDPNQHNTGGYHLRWSRLKKTVMVQEKNSGLLRGSIAAPTATSNAELKLNSGGVGAVEKTILAQVSGCAAPGEVLAMMGPSGSGKTTLLNALSGRTSYDSGILSVNGLPITGNEGALKRLKSKIAYVKQADIMFTHLTVRDQLGYTAFLRLPQAWSRESKLAEVERIIKLLRLSKVADSPISLLSGGEKKRTNIGTELLTDPVRK
jgi:ABC-type glutathione transport system ATPase component